MTNAQDSKPNGTKQLANSNWNAGPVFLLIILTSSKAKIVR